MHSMYLSVILSKNCDTKFLKGCTFPRLYHREKRYSVALQTLKPLVFRVYFYWTYSVLISTPVYLMYSQLLAVRADIDELQLRLTSLLGLYDLHFPDPFIVSCAASCSSSSTLKERVASGRDPLVRSRPCAVKWDNCSHLLQKEFGQIMDQYQIAL